MKSVDRSGQVMIEFILGIVIVLLPLSFLLGFWFYIQEKKTQCALIVFQQARIQLLRTHASVDHSLRCGPTFEHIHLSSLEDLDQNKGGLGIQDLLDEVSQLSERLSQFSQSAQVQASSNSSNEPKI